MDYDNICEICFKDFDNQTIVLNCNHKFHKFCFKMSVNKIGLCPYCRTKVSHDIMSNLFICDAIIKSGKNKGKKCKNNSKHNNYCGIHKNYLKEEN